MDDPPTPENLSSIRPSGWGRKPENGATLMQERRPQQPGGFPDFYPGKDLNNGLRKSKVTVLRGSPRNKRNGRIRSANTSLPSRDDSCFMEAR